MSRWFRGGRSAPAISPTTSLTTSPTNKFEKTWRKYKLLDTEWKEEGRDELKEKVHTMLGADNYNIAVIGPLGSGKSSLINSYISIMNERISSRTHAGFLSSSFTSYFQQIPGKGMFKNIIFYDTKGIEELDKGIPDEDIIKIAEGQIPPGYKFGDSTKKDTKVDENLRIHCLAYVLDAEHVKDGLKDEFRKKITDNMSKMKHICTAPNRVLLLTHIDCVDEEVDEDITKIFKSQIVKEVVEKASGITGIQMNAIFPVKCYEDEMELEPFKDIPLLLALEKMVSYAQDNIDALREDNFSTRHQKQWCVCM